MNTLRRHSVKRGATAGWQQALAAAVAACAALALAATASAQTTVRTLGGGPKSYPLATNNASGSADGNTFNIAQFNIPFGIALDNAGNLYMADFGNNAVRKVSNVGLTNSFTSTIVTGLNGPIAVAVDAANNLYVLTQGDGALRKYDTSGTLLQTLTTTLVSPTAIAFDTSTNLVVTELGGAVKRVTNSAAPGISNLFNFTTPLRGVAVFASNSIAVISGNAIVNLNPIANTTNLIAGNAAAGFADGLAADALFNTPHQMVRAPDGSLIICDRLNHRVRVVSPQGTVSTLYGVGTNQWVDAPNANPALLAGWVDGTAPAAAREPLGVTINGGGTNIFVTEAAWHLLRTVTGASFVPQAPSGGGSGGGTVNMNSNLTANLITFGFQSGEGSTDFIGAAGQTFFAPVTLTLIPGQKMYSLGFSMAATNDAGSPPITSGGGNPPLSYSSMLQRPIPSNPTFFEKIPPSFAFSFVTNYFTNTTDFSVKTNVVPTFTNAVFLDTNVNVLSVA
ncbi:MAG: hypothetical protein HY300_06860, partial [Verrucomicrobia bacterium]|nr:hypothetical protein [Verrucomicrobiota bacterium]